MAELTHFQAVLTWAILTGADLTGDVLAVADLTGDVLSWERFDWISVERRV